MWVYLPVGYPWKGQRGTNFERHFQSLPDYKGNGLSGFDADLPPPGECHRRKRDADIGGILSQQRHRSVIWSRIGYGKDEYSGNSILLPTSGYYNENVDGDDDWDEANVAGDYRSSTWSGGYVIIARGSDVLHISADGIYYDENYLRPSCSSVRPVLDVQE